MKVCSKDRIIFAYGSSKEPALFVDQGEEFQVETIDRFLERGEFEAMLSDRKDILNAVTGPIFVNGAEPGLILKIDILKVEITSDRGVIVAVPGKGGFADKILKAYKKVVKIDKDYVYFNDRIKVPLNPHIGRIGVAPQPPEEIPTGIPGKHGGNMDNNMLKEGSTLYLPIFAKGALLGVGDFHAAMGDGESIVSGVEVPGVATLRCEVVDRPMISWPLLMTKDYVMNMVSAKSLDEAVKIALDDMARLIERSCGMDYVDAAMLISIDGDVRICQIVNPMVTVKVVMPKDIFPSHL
ncbi:MAG: acetamidase/formamidase family protein [Nitrososphaerota archaeon]|nr:acetamidase/formamidase family protein [Nitrososphaerota archaeon]